MFIVKTELKLYLCKSVIACVVVMAVLAAAAGRAGEFLSKQSVISPFTIHVTDNDNSFESKLLVKSLTEFKPDIMHVKQISNTNELSGATASLIIPDNFFADIMAGKKTSAQLHINNENPAVSRIIELFSIAIKEQLTAAQTGVYAVLEYADDNTYSKYMEEVNIVFLSVFMSRFLESETVVSIGNEQYYAFCLYMFVMFLTPCLIIEKSSCFKNVLPLLHAKGAKYVTAFRFLSVVCLYAVVNIPVIAFMSIFLNITMTTPLVVLLIATQSAFCFLCTALFSDVKIAGAVIFLMQLICAFFSGGVVPLAFLPDTFKSISVFLPNFHLLNLYLSETLTAPSATPAAVIALAAFAAHTMGRKTNNAMM